MARARKGKPDPVQIPSERYLEAFKAALARSSKGYRQVQAFPYPAIEQCHDLGASEDFAPPVTYLLGGMLDSMFGLNPLCAYAVDAWRMWYRNAALKANVELSRQAHEESHPAPAIVLCPSHTRGVFELPDGLVFTGRIPTFYPAEEPHLPPIPFETWTQGVRCQIHGVRRIKSTLTTGQQEWLATLQSWIRMNLQADQEANEVLGYMTAAIDAASSTKALLDTFPLLDEVMRHILREGNPSDMDGYHKRIQTEAAMPLAVQKPKATPRPKDVFDAGVIGRHYPSWAAQWPVIRGRLIAMATIAGQGHTWPWEFYMGDYNNSSLPKAL